MELKTAIEILEYHQEWRLGKREDMIHEPKKLTQALDIVLNTVKKISLEKFSLDTENNKGTNKNTAMTTSIELIRSKSEEEVYEYQLEVENFLTFFSEKYQLLDIDIDEYKSTGEIKYITNNVFLDIASEVDKINHLTTVFWGGLCFRYLITFHPYYQDCDEVATDILNKLK